MIGSIFNFFWNIFANIANIFSNKSAITDGNEAPTEITVTVIEPEVKNITHNESIQNEENGNDLHEPSAADSTTDDLVPEIPRRKIQPRIFTNTLKSMVGGKQQNDKDDY